MIPAHVVDNEICYSNSNREVIDDVSKFAQQQLANMT